MLSIDGMSAGGAVGAVDRRSAGAVDPLNRLCRCGGAVGRRAAGAVDRLSRYRRCGGAVGAVSI